MNAIFLCATNHWSPVIGDPTTTGWLTVVVYLLVTILAARLAQKAPFPARRRNRERVFWILLTLCFAVLAVTKQLDLQSFMTATGRCAAKLQGWYADRQQVQMLFLAMVGISGVLGLLCLLWLFRGTLPRTGLPILGLCIVLSFVLMRSAGFHHFDRMLGVPVLSLRANFVLEIAGPLLVGYSAVRQLMRRRGETKIG